MRDLLHFAAFGTICVGAHIYHVLKKKKKINVKRPSDYNKRSAVVVTGCDTGFGNLLSKELAKIPGLVIVSLCLTSESAEELKTCGIHSIQCDVTDDNDVQRAKEFVDGLLVEKNAVLQALVNNAGIANPGDFAFYNDMKAIQKVMDVNFFGQVRITQALLPLFLRTSPVFGGRILNMSSVCGASASAGNSSYNASKFAVEAWSDSLRLELASFNISVVKIRPGQFSTTIQSNWANGFTKQYLNASPQVKRLYGGESYTKKVEDTFKGLDENVMGKPKDAVDAMVELLTAKKLSDLDAYYWLGSDAKTFWRALAALPTKVSDSLKSAISILPIENELTPPAGTISHVTIRVRDIKKSLPFYEAFGLIKAGEREYGQQFLSLGAPKSNGKWSTLVLLKEDPNMKERGNSYEAGMTRLCIYTTTHDQDVKRVKALGLKPIAPTASDTMANVTAFKDPDGFVVYYIAFTRILALFVKLQLWWTKKQSPLLFHWTINVTSSIKNIMQGFESLGFKTFSDQNSSQVANGLLPAFNIDPDTTAIEHIRICNLPDSIFATLMQWNSPKTEKKGSELTNSMTMSVDDVDYVLGIAKGAGFATSPPESRELPVFGKVKVGTIFVEPASAPIEVCSFTQRI